MFRVTKRIRFFICQGLVRSLGSPLHPTPFLSMIRPWNVIIIDTYCGVHQGGIAFLNRAHPIDILCVISYTALMGDMFYQ